MTILEKIKRCVSLVWDFQEIYGEEDIEEFCHNELSTYPQHDEIMEYFKHLADLEKEIAELKGEADSVLDNWCKGDDPCPHLKKRDELLKQWLQTSKASGCDNINIVTETEQLLNGEVEI